MILYTQVSLTALTQYLNTVFEIVPNLPEHSGKAPEAVPDLPGIRVKYLTSYSIYPFFG